MSFVAADADCRARGISVPEFDWESKGQSLTLRSALIWATPRRGLACLRAGEEPRRFG